MGRLVYILILLFIIGILYNEFSPEGGKYISKVVGSE